MIEELPSSCSGEEGHFSSEFVCDAVLLDTALSLARDTVSLVRDSVEPVAVSDNKQLVVKGPLHALMYNHCLT